MSPEIILYDKEKGKNVLKKKYHFVITLCYYKLYKPDMSDYACVKLFLTLVV